MFKLMSDLTQNNACLLHHAWFKHQLNKLITHPSMRCYCRCIGLIWFGLVWSVLLLLLLQLKNRKPFLMNSLILESIVQCNQYENMFISAKFALQLKRDRNDNLPLMRSSLAFTVSSYSIWNTHISLEFIVFFFASQSARIP